MSERATPPAGWYDDPSMVNTRRYWDGQKWTEHRQEKVAAATPPDVAVASEPEKPSGWVQLGYVFAIILPVVGVIIGLILLRTEPYWGKRVIGLSAVVFVVYVLLVATGVIHPHFS